MSFAGGSPTRSTSVEIKTLRETVVKLQQELVHSRAETQKITDQLTCLTMLVKKAWQGDQTASLHVANIIGATPADKEEYSTSNMKVNLSSKPRNRATNNWALLTVGLLNQDYKNLEEQLREKQIQHLQHRYDYFQEELVKLDDTAVNHRKDRRGSANSKKRLPYRQLYRSPNKIPSMPGVTMGDLVLEPNVKKPSVQAFSGLYHTEVNKVKDVDPDRTEVHWSDQRKYYKNGLYETEQVIGAEAVKKRRPVSASSLKSGDKQRARPKSGILSRNERPLKYETTRPVSAPSKRVTSAKQRTKKGDGHVHYIKTKENEFFMTNKESDDEECREADQEPDSSRESAGLQDPEQESMTHIESLKQPESVTQLVDDLEQMNMMEDEFKRSAISLQKKLGISSSGIVY